MPQMFSSATWQIQSGWRFGAAPFAVAVCDWPAEHLSGIETSRSRAARQRLCAKEGETPRLETIDALLSQLVAGRPLADVLASASGTDLMDAVRAAAVALARFNQTVGSLMERDRSEDPLSALERDVARLEIACPELRPELAEVRRRVTEHLTEARPGSIDRSSAPRSSAASRAAAVVMDPALMLARFAALAFEPADARLMRTAAAAFAREYFARVPSRWRAPMKYAYAVALVEVAAGLALGQEDAWKRRAWSLIEEAALAASGSLSFADMWL